MIGFGIFFQNPKFPKLKKNYIKKTLFKEISMLKWQPHISTHQIIHSFGLQVYQYMLPRKGLGVLSSIRSSI